MFSLSGLLKIKLFTRFSFNKETKNKRSECHNYVFSIHFFVTDHQLVTSSNMIDISFIKRSKCDKICFLFDKDHKRLPQDFLHEFVSPHISSHMFSPKSKKTILLHMFLFIEYYSIKNHEKALRFFPCMD